MKLSLWSRHSYCQSTGAGEGQARFCELTDTENVEDIEDQVYSFRDSTGKCPFCNF